ncbi:MAG: hypothetical protein NTW94_00960 [Legionellales bacterium]|nr:hypothetical protein [Legionellales bacterium]
MSSNAPFTLNEFSRLVPSTAGFPTTSTTIGTASETLAAQAHRRTADAPGVPSGHSAVPNILLEAIEGGSDVLGDYAGGQARLGSGSQAMGDAVRHMVSAPAIAAGFIEHLVEERHQQSDNPIARAAARTAWNAALHASPAVGSVMTAAAAAGFVAHATDRLAEGVTHFREAHVDLLNPSGDFADATLEGEAFLAWPGAASRGVEHVLDAAAEVIYAAGGEQLGSLLHSNSRAFAPERTTNPSMAPRFFPQVPAPTDVLGAYTTETQEAAAAPSAALRRSRSEMMGAEPTEASELPPATRQRTEGPSIDVGVSTIVGVGVGAAYASESGTLAAGVGSGGAYASAGTSFGGAGGGGAAVGGAGAAGTAAAAFGTLAGMVGLAAGIDAAIHRTDRRNQRRPVVDLSSDESNTRASNLAALYGGELSADTHTQVSALLNSADRERQEAENRMRHVRRNDTFGYRLFAQTTIRHGHEDYVAAIARAEAHEEAARQLAHRR